jgi:hypothetical protein
MDQPGLEKLGFGGLGAKRYFGNRPDEAGVNVKGRCSEPSRIVTLAGSKSSLSWTI